MRARTVTGWIDVARVHGNFMRKYVFHLAPIEAAAIRIEFSAVHEGVEVAVYEVLVY